jgi:hypothetical protein
VQLDHGRDTVSEAIGELLQVLAPLGEDDRRASFGGELDRVFGDQLGALLVPGERAR